MRIRSSSDTESWRTRRLATSGPCSNAGHTTLRSSFRRVRNRRLHVFPHFVRTATHRLDHNLNIVHVQRFSYANIPITYQRDPVSPVFTPPDQHISRLLEPQGRRICWIGCRDGGQVGESGEEGERPFFFILRGQEVSWQENGGGHGPILGDGVDEREGGIARGDGHFELTRSGSVVCQEVAVVCDMWSRSLLSVARGRRRSCETKSGCKAVSLKADLRLWCGFVEEQRWQAL
jgi:hypothetical protein